MFIKSLKAKFTYWVIFYLVKIINITLKMSELVPQMLQYNRLFNVLYQN